MEEDTGFDVFNDIRGAKTRNSALSRSSEHAGIVDNEEIPEVDGEELQEEEENAEGRDLAADYEKPKQPLSFPWWCRYFALALSYICMVVCCFFIIVKGRKFNFRMKNFLNSFNI